MRRTGMAAAGGTAGAAACGAVEAGVEDMRGF